MNFQKNFEKYQHVLIFSDLYKIFLKEDHSKILKQVDKIVISLMKKKKTIILPTFNLFFPKTKITSFSSDHISTGYLNRYLVKKFNFERTIRPMYNFAVMGPNSKQILALKQSTAWGENSVIGYLINSNALGIGINVDIKSFNWLAIHYCEERAKVPYRIYKNFNGFNYDLKKKVSEKMYVRKLSMNKIEDGRKLNKRLIKLKKIITRKFYDLDISFLNLNEYKKEAEKLLKNNIYSLVKEENRLNKKIKWFK